MSNHLKLANKWVYDTTKTRFKVISLVLKSCHNGNAIHFQIDFHIRTIHPYPFRIPHSLWKIDHPIGSFSEAEMFIEFREADGLILQSQQQPHHGVSSLF